MTVCNMSIEWGARAGLIAPDDTTFAYLEGRPRAPQGADWEAALDRWRALPTDDGRRLRHVSRGRRRHARAAGHLGDEPRDGRPGHGPRARSGLVRRRRRPRGGRAGARVHGAAPRDRDRGHPHRPGVSRLVHELADRGPSCGGGGRRRQAGRGGCHARSSFPAPPAFASRREEEGLDAVFRDAGFEWRLAGCSMCLGDEPRRAGARRALRLDLEPQLRGPPGRGRPHAPRLPRRWRRPRRSTATSSTCARSTRQRP